MPHRPSPSPSSRVRNRTAARLVAALLLVLGAFGAVGVVGALGSPARADAPNHRQEWHLDPDFPPCVNSPVSYYVEYTCTPDQTPPAPQRSFVYQHVVFENGGDVQTGQANVKLDYIGETQPGSYTVSYFDQGWWSEMAYYDPTSPIGNNTAIRAQGLGGPLAGWTGPATTTSIAYGGATQLPTVVVPSAPSLQAACTADEAGGPGTVTCTASKANAADQTSPSYSWQWGDGSTSEGDTVHKTLATDGPFHVTVTSTSEKGLSTQQVVSGDSRVCGGGQCLKVVLSAKPDGTSDDPKDWPTVGQPDTLTTTVTNTSDMVISNIVPVALTGDQFGDGTGTPDPQSVDALQPGQSTTVTWTPTFTQAGGQSLTLHLDGSTQTGRSVFGEDGEYYQVGAPVVVNSTKDDAESSGASNGVCDDGATVSVDGKDVPECTLRAAIQTADASGTAGSITFAIPGSSAVIAPTSPLPPVTAGVTIDATTQPGYAAGSPAVTLDGSGEQGGDGLDVQAAGVTVSGLRVVAFPGDGISFDGADNGSLTSSVIGLDSSGASVGQPIEVAVARSSGVTIGGADTSSGVTVGAGGEPSALQQLASSPTPTIAQALAAGTGVWVGDGAATTTIENSTIGVTETPADLHSTAIAVAGQAGAPGSVTISGDMLGDAIGVLVLGTALPPGAVQVLGTTVGSRGVGVLDLAAPDVQVSGSTFTGDGVGVTGLALPSTALTVDSCTFSGVGGVLIAGSTGESVTASTFHTSGVAVAMLGGAKGSGSAGNVVAGDHVLSQSGQNDIGLLLDHESGDRVTGTDVDASVAVLAGDSHGLTFASDTITGTTEVNDEDEAQDSTFGLFLVGSDATVTGSSFSGLDVGALAGQSGSPGRSLVSQLPDTGTGRATGSAVAASLGTGLGHEAAGSWQTSTPVDGSDLDAADSGPVASTFTGDRFSTDGVALVATAAGTVVGGASDAVGNTITGSKWAAVLAGRGVVVRHNSMTANDTVPDEDGAFLPVVISPSTALPVVAAAYPSGDQTALSGTLSGTPGTTYDVDLYADPGTACTASGTSGLGHEVGTTTAVADSTGRATWTTTVPTALAAGQQVGAVLVEPTEGTTQPSRCTAVSPAGTTTSQDAPAGEVEVPVASNAGFTKGATVVIDPGAADQETATIVDFGSLILDHGLQHEHPAGTTIVELPPTTTTSAPPTTTTSAPPTTTTSAPPTTTTSAPPTTSATATTSAGTTAGTTAGTSTAAPTGSPSAPGPVALLGSSRVAPGDADVVSGTGFAPGEAVQVLLHSQPVLLGTTVADAAGSVSYRFTVPNGTATGAHEVELVGLASGRTASAGLTVESTFADTLPFTGADAADQLETGTGLLLAGTAALLCARLRTRRRH